MTALDGRGGHPSEAAQAGERSGLLRGTEQGPPDGRAVIHTDSDWAISAPYFDCSKCDSEELVSRVSYPHPFHANPEVFAAPDLGLESFQKWVFFPLKMQKKTQDPDQNADPDPGTTKMRIWIHELQKRRSYANPDLKPCFLELRS